MASVAATTSNQLSQPMPLPPSSAVSSTAAPAAPATRPSFYKRPLPSTCIAFDSPEGKALFRASMAEGLAEGYFSLAGAFLTQDEPAYCGLATLCMILNALNVDPQKQWKSAWRFYSQDMLDCCRSLADVAKDGVTLAEFACLARCNGLREYTRYGGSVSIEEFEREIERVCGEGGQGSVMAVSYSRKALGQTGSGHFSPIGGYCKASKRVLVMDVARFKYPSYWVSLENLFNSLTPIDAATGQPRGFSVLRKASALTPHADAGPTTGLFSLNFNKQTWPTFLAELRRLASTPETVVADVLGLLHAAQKQPVEARTVKPDEAAHTPGGDAPQQAEAGAAPSELMSDLYDAEVRSLIALLRPTRLWSLVDAALRAQSPQQVSRYPAQLGYTLFLQALMGSSSAAPQELRHAYHAAVGSHELDTEKLAKEIRFLQDQAASLSKCCTSEKECGCMGKGLQDLTSPCLEPRA